MCCCDKYLEKQANVYILIKVSIYTSFSQGDSNTSLKARFLAVNYIFKSEQIGVMCL